MNPESPKSFSWTRVLLATAIIYGVAWVLFKPATTGHRKDPHRTEAINNLKNLSTSLFEFEAKYGKFPDATTMERVRSDSGTMLALGHTSSNELLRQLIAVGLLPSERPCWAKSAATPRKPDDVMTPGQALVAGECSFAYVAGLSSSSDPNTPLAFGPLIPGTHRFDPKAFGGMAVVLRVDNSVTAMRIRQDNGQISSGVQGMDILDPRHGYWGGKAPDVKWPE